MTTHPSARPWTRLLLAGAGLTILGAAGVVVGDRQAELDQRLASLERELADTPRTTRELAQRLRVLRAELALIQEDLSTTRGNAGDVAAGLAERLEGAEDVIDEIARAIEAHGTSLAQLEELGSTIGPEELEARLAERDESITRQWQDLRTLVDESRSELSRLDHALAQRRDLITMWRELVGPTVQLAGENSVGSGVLLASRPTVDGEGHTTPLLTAWHVVRDIVEGDLDAPVPTTIYMQDGTVDHEFAHILAHDPGLDIALLLLDRDEPVPHGARLAPRERLAEARIFDAVYAVGCPLGNDPIPTPGEIATQHHEVEGENYWMINAPTYIGNSGGGIFDADSHELLGIFSKIYTHGALRPTIVPHMGLATPMESVYDWLEDVGYGRFVPANGAPAVAAASAPPRSESAGH